MFLNNFFDFSFYKPDFAKAARYSSSITKFECIALSLDVYGGDRPALPIGWTRFKSHTSLTGYHGVCYVKDIEKAKPSCIVFAHRGSQQILDIIADISLIFEWVPDQVSSINDFISKIKNKFIKKYGDEKEAVNLGASKS